MKYGEFFELCKNREWPKLRELIRSPGNDLSAKIVVTAIFEVHYPNSHLAGGMGLRTWDKRLFNHPMQSIWDALEGNVDLIDFTKAYHMAAKGLNAENPGLNDEQVAHAIKDYVYAHQTELKGLLQCDILEEQFKEIILNTFEELISHDDDVLDEKYQFDSSGFKTREVVEAERLQLIQEQINDFFGYNQNELKFDKTQASGINLEFHLKTRLEVVEAFTDALNAMGIQASHYDLPARGEKKHGIHVQSSFEMSSQLALYNFGKSCGFTQNGFFAKAKKQAVKAQALREKHRSDAELAASDFGQASNTARGLKR